MADEISINVEIPAEFGRILQDKFDDFAAGIRPFVQTAAGVILNETVKRTPSNTGMLRGSFVTSTEVQKFEIVGSVGSPLIYALPIEEGRKSKKRPPPGALDRWVMLKLGIREPAQVKRVAWAIGTAMIKGTSRGIINKGAHMAREGLKAARPKVMQIISRGIGTTIQAIGSQSAREARARGRS